MSETTTRVDFGSEEHKSLTTDSSGVSTVETDPQESVEDLEVKKQKQQQQDQPSQIKSKKKQEYKKRTKTRMLWYGIFLTGALLLVPITPGTAFLILPMQVAGFAMIPLNKRETRTLGGNKVPKDYLLAPEEKLDDAVVHGVGETHAPEEKPDDTLLHGIAGTHAPEEKPDDTLLHLTSEERAGMKLPNGTLIDLSAEKGDRQIMLVSTEDLRNFLEKESITIEGDLKLESFLNSEGEFSIEKLQEFSEKLPEEAVALKGAIETVTTTLEAGKPLTSLEEEAELLVESKEEPEVKVPSPSPLGRTTTGVATSVGGLPGGKGAAGRSL